MIVIPREAAVVAAALSVATAAANGDDRAAAYHDDAALTAWADALAATHPSACTVTTIGRSVEGRPILALELAMPGDAAPGARPALLVAANLDGDQLAGSTVALAVAGTLLDRAAGGDAEATALLMRHTLYVVPRVNPDAAERFFADVRQERRRNLRPDDADRDGLVDEDPPDDLDGDGLITWMRVPDPRKADRRADPDEPRLDAAADRGKGERPEFSVVREGRDDDGDGELNEDDLGGVDLNMNFMHGYREHADGAGPWPVSEPESLALLRFALDHQNIAAVLVYGVHDNLVETPDGKGKDDAGAPTGILEEDVALYERIGERFREITGLEEAEAEPAHGAFFAWAYAQFGVPAFATTLWARPEVEEQEEDGNGGGKDGGGEAPAADEDGGLTPSGIGDIARETIDALREAAEGRGFEVTDEMVADLTPERVERFAANLGVTVQRVGGSPGGGRAADKNAAAWLAYSDSLGGIGFVPWHDLDHPDLGPVQVGGWVPYFRVTPPPDALPAIADRQVEFVLDLAGRLPRLRLDAPKVKRLAPGLYEVRTALVNDGDLPTGTAMAVKNRRARPHVVRLDIPLERVVSGPRVHKVWSIPGAGGREELRWILEAGDGDDLHITVFSEKYGSFDTTVPLIDNQEDTP